jgi:hypothetical protein
MKVTKIELDQGAKLRVVGAECPCVTKFLSIVYRFAIEKCETLRARVSSLCQKSVNQSERVATAGRLFLPTDWRWRKASARHFSLHEYAHRSSLACKLLCAAACHALSLHSRKIDLVSEKTIILLPLV